MDMLIAHIIFENTCSRQNQLKGQYHHDQQDMESEC